MLTDADPFFIRNLVYGIEDSLLSTTGVIVGISLAGQQRAHVLVTGFILVLVEALSMALGSFLSEDTFMKAARVQHTTRDVMKYAAVMCISYLVAGLVPMLPFILDLDGAWKYSVAFALTAMYVLVRTFHEDSEKKAGVFTSVAAVVLAVSVFAGRFLNSS
jgi:VIT1/CCC1 family predicted Fe2+/Mn2+ transporter